MNLTERRRTVSLAVKVYALVGLLAALVVGCATDPYPLSRPCDWSRPECWYQDERPTDEKLVDVFYVTSTDIMSSKDAEGRPAALAALTREECAAEQAEMDWFRKNIYTSEFNYFAPLYHQVTFESLGNPSGGRDANWDAAAEEVCGAFDYYMATENRGRRFILVGFSQGASILRTILKHMTDEQYARCVAAYSIGFQVTAEDLASPHVRAAQGADDQGVIISFNSVSKSEGRMPLLSDRSACSINPVNWRTDATPAEFEYGGQTLTATLDVTNHLVVVQGFTPPKTAFSHLFPDGNLHTYERLLYSRQLHDNAVLRAYGR